MRCKVLIVWLGALVATLQFGGFTLYAHNVLQHGHHAFVTVSEHAEHDGDRPDNHLPDDTDNCPSCLTITRSFGTVVCLTEHALVLEVVGCQVEFSAEQIVETSPIRLHAGRGPPLTSI